MNEGTPEHYEALSSALDHLNAALSILDEGGVDPILGAHVDLAAERVAASIASFIAPPVELERPLLGTMH